MRRCALHLIRYPMVLVARLSDAAFVENMQTAMGHIWKVTPANTRLDLIRAGMDWVRIKLAATELGLGMQPLSQALHEKPEISGLYDEVHRRLAPMAEPRMIFALFNGIGIVEQPGRTMFEARLPKEVLVPHFAVAHQLVRVCDGRTPLELATSFQVPKTTLSHTLALLVGRGWIEVLPNPEDLRSKQVWITEDGRRFRDGAIARLAPDVARLAQDPALQGVEDLVARLAEIRKHMDRARDPR